MDRETPEDRCAQDAPGVSPRDADTLAKLAARDEAGLRQMLQDHARGMLTLMQRLFGDDFDREDVLYRMVLRVWQGYSTFDPTGGSFRRWLWAIARNEALKQIRAERKWEKAHRFGWDMDGFLAPAPGVEYSAADREFVRDLRRCLARLPPQQQQITVSDIQAQLELSARELAEALETTPEAIYAGRSKARARLRLCIEERQRQRAPRQSGAESESQSGVSREGES